MHDLNWFESRLLSAVHNHLQKLAETLSQTYHMQQHGDSLQPLLFQAASSAGSVVQAILDSRSALASFDLSRCYTRNPDETMLALQKA